MCWVGLLRFRFFFFWKCGPVKKTSKKTSGVWKFFVEKLCRHKDWAIGGDFLFELEKKHHLRLHIQPHSVVGIMISILSGAFFPKMLFCVSKFRTAGPIPRPARVGYVGISSKGFQDPRMSYHESAKDFMDPAVSWHDFCTRRSSANQQK